MRASHPVQPPRRPRRRWSIVLATLGLLVGAGLVAFRTSPWPSALLIRWAFDRGGVASDAALKARVPAGVSSQTGLRYDLADADALFDIHFPAHVAGTDRRLTTIVWVHGGGFLAGSRTQVANYARLLAADGYAVVAVDYSIAPGAQYPTPVRQLNRALAHLSDNADRLHIDRARFVLAGDSAGAQLAAQVAALVSSPDYANAMGLTPGIARSQLVGTVLFCGPHDALTWASDASASWFLRTVVWSYLGAMPPDRDKVEQFSVARHVTPAFPPTFISVGNADPLAVQSVAMADALQREGVRVERLFFARDHAPALAHEYQFDLEREEARHALARVRAFLAGL